jgi:type II secretory pathway pseudopilin PulG
MTMDQKTKKTWISVIVAILIICVVLGVAVIGTAVYVFRQHVNTQFVSPQTAQDEFQQARQRFSGQEPLVAMGAHGEALIHRRTVPNAPEIQAIRVLAFDPRANKLVRVSIPFWLLRMAPSKNFTVFRNDGFDFDSESMHLTVDDLERAGPGLIVDAKDRHGTGGQVLVWAE